MPILRLRKNIIFFVMLLAAGNARAQQTDTRVQQLLSPGTDSVSLGSLPVLRDSIAFYDLSGKKQELDYTFHGGPQAYLKWKKALSDTLILRYRRIALRMNDTFQNKSLRQIIPATTAEENLDNQLYEAESEGFRPFGGLNSQGSLSRSVSLGNNQDAVLNSSLNLQLTGNLGNNTEIRASIRDNNVPVQADGFTQQLREFDRVYLELENPDFGLARAGDFNMLSQNNYFLNFDKRISGAALLTGVNAGEGRLPIQLQAGLARGRFTRNRFQGQEGNQGPYKLQGANGEQFIIIISGSERVYIDGVLQTRGEQNDYVVDYNAGELTFTAQQPITKDHRIVIEFQYSERNFLRPLVFAQSGYKSERVNTLISYYSESDSRNQTLTTELSDEDKERLSRAGDNPQKAFAPALSRANFDPDQIQYRLVDTLGFDSVLVFSTDSNARLYQASFTLVGANRGHYRPAPIAANGQVYEWVAPINGVPQGNYAPLRRIPTPNQLQVVALSSRVQLNEREKIGLEWALSQRDLNLFSDRDDGDNVGMAGRLGYENTQKTKKGAWQSVASLEFNQERFNTVERVRAVEFSRDWNLPISNDLNGLVLAEAQTAYQADNWRWRYRLSGLHAGEMQGLKNHTSFQLRQGRHLAEAQASWLSSSDSSGSTQFWRETAQYRYYLTSQWWLGLRSLGEWNRRDSAGSGQLRTNSYAFFENEWFTGIGDTTAHYAEFGFRQRSDDTARQGQLERFANGQTWYLRGSAQTNFNSRLQAFINLRRLRIRRPVALPEQRTLSSRLNYVQRFFKNAMTSTTFYESGAGSQPRRNFRFVEVPAGQGTHTWNDFNDNGIPELGEFEPAPTPDLATFIRVFTPSSEFVRTSQVKLGQNVQINSPANWSGKDDWRKWVSRFSLLGNFQVDRQTLLDGNQNRLQPFGRPESDSLLVGLTSNWRGTLFFNRARNAYGADYTYRASESLSLVSFGIEARRNAAHEVNLRYAPISPLLMRSALLLESKENQSEATTDRNFTIAAQQWQYELTYQVGQNFSLTGRYRWQRQENTGEVNPALLVAQNGELQLVWNVAQKIALESRAAYIFNDFNGESNSPVGFEMLRELKPGANATLEVSLRRTLFKNIVVSLTYNGRASRQNPIIHFGNVEVKAFF